MIGENVLVFTRKGYKRVAEIELYDEVLTRYGTFESVTELGPWQKIDSTVVLSTGELIMCNNDTLWHGRASSYPNESMEYTEDINVDGDDYSFSNIKGCSLRSRKPVYSPYDYAVVVPTGVPQEYLLSNDATKLAFFAGLVDSPICEANANTPGVYVFYTLYKNLEIGIITLARSLGWNVNCRYEGKLSIISVYPDEKIHEIPIKDDYKIFDRSSLNVPHVKIIDIMSLPDDYNVYGRYIKVDSGGLLVGYSLVPVN